MSRLLSAGEDTAHVHPDWDLHTIVPTMSDFNLAVAPVLDDDHRMIGVVTVDDVLELVMPSGQRSSLAR